MRRRSAPLPTAAATAVVSSSAKRTRFLTLPPYSSVRWFGARLQELLDEVPVGSVQLDAVETCAQSGGP